MKRFFCVCLAIALLVIPVKAEPIKWVDFQIPYESLKYAMEVDIQTFDQEKHIRWVDVLALAGCRSGGKCGLSAVKKAVKDLHGNDSPENFWESYTNTTTIITRRMKQFWVDSLAATALKKMENRLQPMD